MWTVPKEGWRGGGLGAVAVIVGVGNASGGGSASTGLLAHVSGARIDNGG